MLVMLADVGYQAGEAVEILKNLTDFASNEIAGSFSAVGRGIGAIMLLVVSLYYIISILDGGKFQLKMMMPLLVFLLVCNFSWISRPVVSFCNTITSTLVSECEAVKARTKMDMDVDVTANINDIVNTNLRKDQSERERVLQEKAGEELTGNVTDTTAKVNATGAGVTTRIVTKGIDNSFNGFSMNVQKELSGVKPDEDKKPWWKGDCWNSMILSFVSSIISFVCTIMSYVLRAFGGVMSGIIVAFGPITFAFAIFPGQGGTIKSWFIRLCQFSLWAPLCALIDCFSIRIFQLIDAASGSGFAMAIAVGVCNLVALTSVPSIASMIIEGAQGAVSLSQGLQSVGQTIGLSAAIAKGSAAAVAGKERMTAVADTVRGIGNAGAVGVAKDALIKGRSIKGFMSRMHVSGRNSRLGKS